MSEEGGTANSEEPKSQERLTTETVRALYEVHGRDVLTFLTGVLRNQDAAQDACQATFQRLLEVGHETREETVRGWLFKVAFHEAMAWRRKQSRGDKLQKELAADGQDPIVLDHSLQSLIRTEEVTKLRRLLQDLPVEQQFVVQRRIHNNQTFAAIADELNVPLGTVLTRMRLAVEKLQKWFGHDG